MKKILMITAIVIVSLTAILSVAFGVYWHHNLHWYDRYQKALDKVGAEEKQFTLPNGNIINYGEVKNDKPVLLLIHGQMGVWEDYALVSTEPVCLVKVAVLVLVCFEPARSLAQSFFVARLLQHHALALVRPDLALKSTLLLELTISLRVLLFIIRIISLQAHARDERILLMPAVYPEEPVRLTEGCLREWDVFCLFSYANNVRKISFSIDKGRYV